MLALATEKRNRVLLRILYGGGLRVSEACGLKGRDLQVCGEGDGQLKIFGKGGKTRAVKPPPALWQDLTSLRGDFSSDDPVFPSRKAGHLDAYQVARMVRAALSELASKLTCRLIGCATLTRATRSTGERRSTSYKPLGHSCVSTTGTYTGATG